MLLGQLWVDMLMGKSSYVGLSFGFKASGEEDKPFTWLPLWEFESLGLMFVLISVY